MLAAALSFFSLYFLYNKYHASLEASTHALSAKVQVMLSETIHRLQIERALSAGYVADKQPKQKTFQINQTAKQTDQALRDLNALTLLNTREKKELDHLLKPYTEPYMNQVQKKLKKLQDMRQRILRQAANLDEVIDYYGSLVQNLFEMYFGLMWTTRSGLPLGNDLLLLEDVKEHAGLERTRIYHQVLQEHYEPKEISTTRELIEKQKRLENAFLSKLTASDKKHYHEIVRKELIQRVEHMRQRVFVFSLTKEDANRWFGISTTRIDAMERYIYDITRSYEARQNKLAKKATREFYTLFVLGVVSFVSFLMLVYYLERLLKNDERLKEDLRIASFAFESYEAIAVTDIAGTILRVNRAFSRATGYTEQEAIGQNPNILKSGRHSNVFYEQMQHDLAHEGHWSGEIYIKRKNGEIYPGHLSITAIKNDEGLITHYIYHSVDISDIKDAEEEARHQALHDFLTGLPNRKSMIEKLHEELARSKRHGFVGALFFIDLDDFKRFNDSSGHLAGDKLLIEVARRLKKTVRKEDHVARISGDEFCIVLVEVAADYEQAAERTALVADKILSVLGEPFVVDATTAHIGASIGIRLFPDEADDAQHLIMQADASMYKAKESGKNCYVFFDEKIQARYDELMCFQAEIHRALEHNEIVFYCQPKVAFKTGEITGAELMVRWEHPERGLLFPGDFLEAFENMSLMPHLTEMALAEACRAVQEIKGFDGVFSINITAYELRSGHFVERAEQIIQDARIDPTRIELEILENDLIEDFDAVIENMNRLRRFGVRFSIDDFGVGYSSINYLNKLPVDTLKIDHKFVLGLDDNRTRETIRIITRFSRVYELKTVIEWVETQDELEILSRLGLDDYQGFYFSRAVNVAAFHAMIEKQQANSQG